VGGGRRFGKKIPLRLFTYSFRLKYIHINRAYALLTAKSAELIVPLLAPKCPDVVKPPRIISKKGDKTMKTISVLVALAVVGGAFGQEVVIRGSGGYGLDSPYNKLYDTNRQIVITGKVTGKSFAAPIKGMGEAMSILVKTPKNGTIQVDLGPRWFVADQLARVNIGDKVKVIGSDVRIDGNRVILAKQIVNPKGKVLALRDYGGAPYWSASRQGVATNIPADAVSGTVLSSGMVTVDEIPMVNYVVQTPNGNVNVVTAPDWYWNHQDVTIGPGAAVRILGVNRVVQAGPGLFIANTIYSGGNTFTLRNNGIPVWNGWGGRY